MRIVGYIEHPILKITIFKMDDKRAVKFEAGLLEQTFKFRASEGCSTLEEIQDLIDTTFVKNVELQFEQMYHTKNEALKRVQSTTLSEEFEEII